MRNSKKNKGNDLLPQRKPKLGKFILLAVILHVVFAIFLIHFYKKKPEEVPGIKVKSQKVISKPLLKRCSIRSDRKVLRLWSQKAGPCLPRYPWLLKIEPQAFCLPTSGLASPGSK